MPGRGPPLPGDTGGFQGAADVPKGFALPGQIQNEADRVLFLLVPVQLALARPTPEGDVPAGLFPDLALVLKGGFGAVGYLVPFEFRQDRQHTEDHLPGGGRGVNLFA